MDDDAVVGPDRVCLELELLADLLSQRQPPGGVDAAAEGREQAEAPVADLVAEALDYDRLVGGNDAGRRLLLARSEEHTSELQSHSDLVCRLLLEQKHTTF